MPCNHETNIDDVIYHHGNTLPELQTAIPKKRKAEARSHDEEAHVSDKALACNVEWLDESHRSSDHRCDEHSCSHEFSHR
jgi:hypothetical protein